MSTSATTATTTTRKNKSLNKLRSLGLSHQNNNNDDGGGVGGKIIPTTNNNNNPLQHLQILQNVEQLTRESRSSSSGSEGRNNVLRDNEFSLRHGHEHEQQSSTTTAAAMSTTTTREDYNVAKGSLEEEEGEDDGNNNKATTATTRSGGVELVAPHSTLSRVRSSELFIDNNNNNRERKLSIMRNKLQHKLNNVGSGGKSMMMMKGSFKKKNDASSSSSSSSLVPFDEEQPSQSYALLQQQQSSSSLSTTTLKSAAKQQQQPSSLSTITKSAESDTTSSLLPNGWKRAKDYKTQKYYYYHRPSNKVSWEVPSDLKDFQVTKKLDNSSNSSSISEKERKVYYKEDDRKREAKVEKKRNVSARSNTTKENNNSVKVDERVVSRRGRSATRNYNNNGEKKQRRASSLKATSKYSTYTSITTTCSNLDSTTLEQQQQRQQRSKSSSSKRVTFQDQVDNTKQQQTNRRRRSTSSPSLQFSSLFNVKRAKERKSSHNRGSFSPTTRNNDSSSGRRRRKSRSSSSPSIVKMNKFITRVSEQVQLQQRGGCLSPSIPNMSIGSNLVTLRDGLLSSLQCGGGIGGQVGGLPRCTLTAIEVDENEDEGVMVNRVNSLLLFDDDDDDDKSTPSLLGVEEEEKKADLTMMMMKPPEAFEVRYKGVNESQYCSSSSSESLDDDDHAKDDDNNKLRRGRRNTFLSSSRPPLRRLSMTTSPSSRSFEALNLMKSRAKNKIQSSESLSSIKLFKLRNPDAPLLLKNSAKKCSEQQQKILSFRNNNHHRRTMSGGNVFSPSVVAQSLLRRSASFSLNRSVASLMTDDDDNGRDREVRKEEGGLPDGNTSEGKDDDDSLDIIDDPWRRRTRSIDTPTGKARTTPGSERRGGEGVKSQMQRNLFQQHNHSVNILHDSQVGDSVQWKARITEIDPDPRDSDQARVVETSGQDQEEGDGEEMKECQHRRDVSTESPTGVDELTTFYHRDSSLPSPGTCSPSNLEERLKQCNNEDESGTRASNAADDDGGSTGVPRTIKASAKTTINASNVELELIEEEVDSNDGDEGDCRDKVAEKVAGAKENSNAQDTAAAALLMRQQQKYEFEAFEVKYRSLPPKQRAYEEALLTLKSKKKERLHIRAHPAAAKSVNNSNVRVTININEDDSSIAFTSSTSNWRDEDNRSVSTIASSVEDFNKSRSMEEEDVNSMSAMYSQDEEKMHERKICTKDILNEGNNILDDFNTVSAESALTTDSPNNELLLGWDIPPELPEGQNSSNTRKNEKNEKSTRDCNYGTTMETAYEDFGVERQLAKVSEEGKKIRQGVKIPFSQKPKFGLPFPRSNPVDVDELSLSVASLADDSVKDVSVGELVQADTINCICGDWNVAEGVKANAACGDVDDLRGTVRDTTNAVIEWDGDIDKIGVPDEPIFDKIIDVLDIAMNGYDKACDVEYDCRTEYDGQTEFDGQTMHDGKTIDGLGFDDGETICHGDISDEEDGNDSQKTYPPRQKEAIANTDAIKMQGLVFVSPNAENPNTAYLSSEGL